MNARLIGIGAAVLTLSCSWQAAAQTDNRVALGVSFTKRVAGSSEASDTISIGFQWRLGHKTSGWGWHYAFNWFSTDVTQPIGGQSAAFGALRVRPLMGGYGYTRAVGRTAITTALLGGYAVNSFELTPSANDAYRDRLGARSVAADVSNTWVIKPEVSVWRDVSRKIGVVVSAGYVVARPTVTVTSTLGEDARRIRADMVVIKAGVAYSIF